MVKHDSEDDTEDKTEVPSIRLTRSEAQAVTEAVREVTSTPEDSNREVTAHEGIPHPSSLVPPNTPEEAEFLLSVGERCFELALGNLNNPEGNALIKTKAQKRREDEEDPPLL